MESQSGSLIEHFSILKDPRLERHKRHNLIDILVITMSAVICGADTWDQIEEFGQAKYDWFKTFLELPNGVPSHDTINRVFSLIDPKAFSKCFISWMQSLNSLVDGEIVAIDGKQLRHSYDKQSGKAAIHMVSAFATANGVVLGQETTQEKSNEITAIPELLDKLFIAGCIVTIDAMGCQKKIAEKIIDKQADYVLALKGNQGSLYDDVKLFLDAAHKNNFNNTRHNYFETVNKGHGRIEVRRAWITDDIDWLDNKEKWKGLKSIGVVEAERHIGSEISIEKRYYINSIDTNAQTFLAASRQHWGIENKVHWSLDVVFGEDNSRIRQGYAAENLAVVRHIALNVLNADKETKGSKKTKRLMAGWCNSYLMKLLNNVLRF